MKPNVKQKQPVVQAAINNALSGGGSGGTSDYTDLSNKPSINSVTLTGNKTTNDLGIKQVPEVNSSEDNKFLKAIYDIEKQKGDYYWYTINQVPAITQGDTNKLLKANYNNGNPQAEWTTVDTVPSIEYADWGNVHLSYVGSNHNITGTYEVEYNGFATIVFNTDYRDIAQALSPYSFQGLEADFTITLTRDQQNYALIDTTLYFPNDSSSSQLNFITTNSNFSLALPVLVGDKISMSISSSNMDQSIGGNIESCTKLKCFVQKYV